MAFDDDPQYDMLYGVGRIKVSLTVPGGSAAVEGRLEDILEADQIFFVVPELDDAGDTAELKVLDDDDNVHYASGEKAFTAGDTESYQANNVGLLHHPTIRVETSDNQAGGTTFNIVIFGKVASKLR